MGGFCPREDFVQGDFVWGGFVRGDFVLEPTKAVADSEIVVQSISTINK